MFVDLPSFSLPSTLGYLKPLDEVILVSVLVTVSVLRHLLFQI